MTEPERPAKGLEKSNLTNGEKPIKIVSETKVSWRSDCETLHCIVLRDRLKRKLNRTLKTAQEKRNY